MSDDCISDGYVGDDHVSDDRISDTWSAWANRRSATEFEQARRRNGRGARARGDLRRAAPRGAGAGGDRRDAARLVLQFIHDAAGEFGADALGAGDHGCVAARAGALDFFGRNAAALGVAELELLSLEYQLLQQRAAAIA